MKFTGKKSSTTRRLQMKIDAGLNTSDAGIDSFERRPLDLLADYIGGKTHHQKR
jgi:hypothetical protein